MRILLVKSLLCCIVLSAVRYEEVASAEDSHFNKIKILNDGKEQFAVGTQLRVLKSAPLTHGPFGQGEQRNIQYDTRETSYLIVSKQKATGPHLDIDIRKLEKGDLCFEVQGTYKDAHVVTCGNNPML